jgi:hypothetical protein
MNTQKLLRQAISIALILLLLGCSAPAATSAPVPPTASATLAPASPPPTASAAPTRTSPPPTASATLAPASPSPTASATLAPTSPPTAAPTNEARADGLSDQQAAILNSLEKIDDYPLYVMHYYGDYEAASPAAVIVTVGEAGWPSSSSAWACSLFAALGAADNRLYGRNFDWEYSPALLLFTHPPDGYDSVSMVDVDYMIDAAQVGNLTDLPLAERKPLLDAPRWPFDGMNEHGLVVGMAAVPASDLPRDSSKATIDSISLIREMLDHARSVDEALAIVQSYNVDMGGGPHIHYLLADASGRAALLEFYRGEMVVLPNQDSWHLATNFLRAQASDELGQCQRYDKIFQRLTESAGQLNAPDAMELLSQVAQGNTQWSVVYEMSTGSVNVVVGQEYDEVYNFYLDLAGE